MVTPTVKPDDSFNSSKISGIKQDKDQKIASEKDVKKVEKIAEDAQLTKGPSGTQFDTARTAIPPSGDQHLTKAGENLAKAAIKGQDPFSTLLKEITDPNFKNNSQRKHLLNQLKKQMTESTVSQKADIAQKVLKSQQHVETIFQTLGELFGEPELSNILLKMPTDFNEKFCILLFESPGQALKMISKLDSKLLISKGFTEELKENFQVGVSNKNDKDFASCIEYLRKLEIFGKPDSFYGPWSKLKTTLIRCNLPLSLKSVNGSDDYDNRSIEEMLKWDSTLCLGQVKNLDKYYSYRLEDSSKKAPQLLLERAVDSQASKCLALLLQSFTISPAEKEDLNRKCLEMGDIASLLSLNGNNPAEAAKYVFSELGPLLRNPAPYQKKIEEMFEKILKKYFRYNPVHLVDKVVDGFMSVNSAAAEIFPAVYQRVRKEFLEIAPFISRYAKKEQVINVIEKYTNDVQRVLSEKLGDPSKVYERLIEEELEYAKFCRTHVEDLLQKLDDGSITKPKESEFAQLPRSGRGTQRAAALIEIIGGVRSDQQKKRKGETLDNTGKLEYLRFKELRTTDFQTTISNRYISGFPLVCSVNQFSQSPDMTRSISECVGFNKDLLKTYNMKLYDKVLTNVGIQQDPGGEQWWYHGRLPVKDTWSDVENAFEDLMNFNLEKPVGNDPELQKNYERRLDRFYKTAAKLVWLIGNTTPLSRGSGTVAEWLLGIVCLKNGLQPPVLKPQFPQLDVLDITFPLSDYQEIFTYFFEPSSLPPHMKWPDDLSEVSIFAQMEILYNQMKALKEIGIGTIAEIDRADFSSGFDNLASKPSVAANYLSRNDLASMNLNLLRAAGKELRSIKLDFTPTLDDLKLLKQICPNIRDFKFSTYEETPDDVLLGLADLYPNMDTFHFSAHKTFSQATLKQFFSKCKNLKTISSMPVISSELLNLIAEHYPNLEYLRASIFVPFSDETIKNLKRLKNLRHINLSNPKDITNEQLVNLFSQPFPHLERLFLNIKPTKELLALIAKNCPNLKLIAISKQEKFDETDIKLFEEFLAGLQSLRVYDQNSKSLYEKSS